MGSKDQIKRGIKIWEYLLKEVEQLRWKEIHLRYMEDVEIIGEGNIGEVDRYCSLVLPGQKNKLSKLRLGGHVIMK